MTPARCLGGKEEEEKNKTKQNKKTKKKKNNKKKTTKKTEEIVASYRHMLYKYVMESADLVCHFVTFGSKKIIR